MTPKPSSTIWHSGTDLFLFNLNLCFKSYCLHINFFHSVRTACLINRFLSSHLDLLLENFGGCIAICIFHAISPVHCVLRGDFVFVNTDEATRGVQWKHRLSKKAWV